MSETFMENYERSVMFFEAGDYVTASRMLAELVGEAGGDVSLRLLLARAYFHSAQLGRAEAQLREVLERDPVEAYAHLLLGRTLQRRNRHDEAGRHLRLAGALSGEPVAEDWIERGFEVVDEPAA
ncbi:tetratricopeptide repeat protein [Pseudonocardia acaciae]|uniref:tetratricopeptide repeat protein n=1 Tax=Pseudonocardia acaciae TaxID=551276 RepID=UPI000492156A|nr:tetratricopeptide repeat protein [Pseudonocardia acaciae]